jgi:hypothetical protein
MEHDFIIISPDNKVSSVDHPQGTLARILGTAAGKRALAQAMTRPLRTTLDYSNIARKCFVVEQLPAGALPCYDSSDK